MKIILAALMALSVNAFADGSPFYTEIRGVRFYCAPVDDQPDNGTAYDCIQKAYAGPFSKSESEQLCSGAYSAAPADCAIKAYSGPFSKSESLDLCASKSSSERTANCAIKAYSGPYSKAEAIRICKSNFTADSMYSYFGGTKAFGQKQSISKAQEQLRTATEKLQDAKIKAFENVLDLKMKQ